MSCNHHRRPPTIIWDKLALNGARMVKIALGGEIFVFGKVREMRIFGYVTPI